MTSVQGPINIPDIIIFQLATKFIDVIRKQVSDVSSGLVDERDSFLYVLFNRLSISGFDFYQQAKEIFGRDQTDPRYLRVTRFYDRQKTDIPTVTIVVPNGSPGQNTMSFTSPESTPGMEVMLQTQVGSEFSRSFKTQIGIQTTSGNREETIIIHNTLKAGFIAMKDSILANGLLLPVFTERDMTFYDQMIPANIFGQALMMEVIYSVTVPSLIYERLWAPFAFNQPILYNENRRSEG